MNNTIKVFPRDNPDGKEIPIPLIGINRKIVNIDDLKDQEEISLDLKIYKDLEELYVRNKIFTNINLTNCTNLRILILNNFDIKEPNINLDLSKCTELKELKLSSASYSFNEQNHLNLAYNRKLEYIYLDLDVDHPLDLHNNINLNELIIQRMYNYPLNLAYNIRLVKINLHLNIDQPLDLHNNRNLNELIITGRFNYPLDLTNNTQLRILKLDCTYNHPLDLIYNTQLKTLIIGIEFNHPLDLTNCTQLKTLIIGIEFNHPLDLTNCTQLEELMLGKTSVLNNNRNNFGKFNQPLNLIYNTNLKVLLLGAMFNCPLNLTNCAELEELMVGYRNESESIPPLLWEYEEFRIPSKYGYNNDLDLTFNTKLTKLWLNSNTFGYPLDLSNLISLKKIIIIGYWFNEYLDFTRCFNLIEIIIISNRFNNQTLLDKYNSDFLDVVNEPLYLSNCSELKNLIIIDYDYFGITKFNQKIILKNCIKLQHLVLGNKYNQPLDIKFSPNLRILEIGHKYDQPLDLRYCPNLISLVIRNRYYNKNITIGVDENKNYIPNIHNLDMGNVNVSAYFNFVDVKLNRVGGKNINSIFLYTTIIILCIILCILLIFLIIKSLNEFKNI
jgi:hypothetical protein